MGFHVSPEPETGFIHGGKESLFGRNSSGDNCLEFASGRKYWFPDALAYYVVDCGYQPPEEFIQDIMESAVSGENRLQTKGIRYQTRGFNPEMRVGYLDQKDVNEAATRQWDSKITTREAFTAKLFEVYPELLRSQKQPPSAGNAPKPS